MPGPLDQESTGSGEKIEVDAFEEYRSGLPPKGNVNFAWLLSGSGYDHFGVSDQPVSTGVPEFGPEELLVRHDAVGLCAADVKLIRLGQQHPRVISDLAANPVAIGHEVTLTVVGVGDQLMDQFHRGDRFVVQPDIHQDGKAFGYGFALQGGLSQYSVLDNRTLNGDDGCYLLPVKDTTGYAESAMTEAFAAVVATYRLSIRDTLKPGGVCWIIGSPLDKAERARKYTISAGMDKERHPSRVLLSNVPTEFAEWTRERSGALGFQLQNVDDATAPPIQDIDDIILLGPDPNLIETASRRLAFSGVMCVLADEPLNRKVRVDVGRVHYDRWVFTGSSTCDVAMAYNSPPVLSTLKPSGRAWFLGAGGPIGRTHVQRAIQLAEGPSVVFCTALHPERIDALRSSYETEALSKGVDLCCIARTDPSYDAKLASYSPLGFDNILVCAPSAEAIAEAFPLLAPGGVMNIFAGVARNTEAELDLSSTYMRGIRLIGFSGSTVDDMRLTLRLVEEGEFMPNRLVMAVGSIHAAKEGLKAVQDSVFPGKIVIYNHIRPLPLTRIKDLRVCLPEVYAKTKAGTEWTNEAEKELFRRMLSTKSS